MKAIPILITLVFLFSLGTGILAQETELPDPGLTPDSPFYFLETIAEDIVTFFTFGDLKKAERYAALAAERLSFFATVINFSTYEESSFALAVVVVIFSCKTSASVKCFSKAFLCDLLLLNCRPFTLCFIAVFTLNLTVILIRQPADKITLYF